ncbi:hypothetical protein [Shimazuella kribbensis]|uniref:hypothetical protein n=1 Tax=Shimazuella kribbensis TaxID=139808 RepID=UPI0004087A5C|nr:hypothetical protein [Shimazuella kribbensis]
MMNKENQVLPIDDDLKNLITLALVKYQKEIEEKILVQRSQLKAALFMERKAQIQRAIRTINPINKDLLPSLTKKQKKQGEYHES